MRTLSVLILTVLAAAGSIGRAPADPGGDDGPEAIVQASDHTVRMELEEGSEREYRFQFHTRAVASGQPTGQQLFFPGKLRVTGNQMLNGRSGPGGPRLVELEIPLDSSELIRADDGPVVVFSGTGQRCIAEDRCETQSFTGTVRPSVAHDCLIYEILGPNVQTTFESAGTFVVRS